MKGLKQLALAMLCLLGLYGGTVNARVQVLDRIVAIVDKESIMSSELENRLKVVRRQLAGRNMPVPAEAVLRQQVLDQLIVEAIQLQMGQRLGIRIDELTLNDTIEKIAQRNNMTVQDFRRNIEADGLSFAQAREEIQREMIINRVRQRLVGERIQVSEQEIENYLKSPEGQSRMTREYRLGYILIEAPENASDEQVAAAKEQARSVAEQLQKGASFSELAITYSRGQNAANGGDLGWRKLEQLPNLFARQAATLDKGQVSDPLYENGGFHIFKLMDRRGNEQYIQEQVNVRHILLKPNEVRSDLEAQMLAKDLYNRIAKGEAFAELAKVYSDDTASALNGGELGWISPASLVLEFQTMIAKVAVNTVSQPFKSPYGWHIMEVLGKRKSDISSQVRRNQVRELLGGRKFEEELVAWLREIRDQAYVEIIGK